jgi:hypothetical protein
LDNAQTRISLRGLEGIYVILEDLKPDVEEDGLTRRQIEVEIMKRLKTAGIKTLSEEEWRKEQGWPWLYVYAHIIKKVFVEKEVYIFHISFELKQKVTLVRDPDREVFATTWSKAVLGKSGYINDMEESIGDLTDSFIRAYHAVRDKRE